MPLINFRRKKNNPIPYDFFSTSFVSSDRSYEVDEEQALQIPAFKTCLDLITNTISQLPINLFVESIDSNIQLLKDDSRSLLLNEKPNAFDTASKLKKDLVKDLLLYGRAYLYQKNEQEYFVLPSKNVTEEYYTNDGITVEEISYIYTNWKGTQQLTNDKVIRFDSGAKGVLHNGSEILSTAINELNYSKNILKNGALPVGILKAASRLTQKAIDNLRSSWESLYSGSTKAGKTIILEDGLSYENISYNPEQLQLNETSKRITAEIARLFNVPESLVNSSANKYNSLEQNNLQYLQYTIGPILKVIEETLDKHFLEEYELNSGYYFRFDTSEVLRTTEKEKVDTTLNLFNNGVLSFNEVRSRLDLSIIDSTKDYYKLNLGTVIKYKETGDISIINTGQILHEGDTNNADGTVKKQQG